MLMTLDYEGQEIDISGADNIKIRDVRTGEWKSERTDFSRSLKLSAYSLEVPVMSPEDLIAYKSMLEGRHQGDDIRAIFEWINANRK
jgi:hypothetical protein